MVLDEAQWNLYKYSGQNILSYLLLDSEIKGLVENPMFYFQEENSYAHLDNLLLYSIITHFYLIAFKPFVYKGFMFLGNAK